MEKQLLRKVKFNTDQRGSGPYSNNGYFHTWGNRIVPQDNGDDLTKIIAVIENVDGIVVEIEPQRIKFVEEF